MYFHELHCKNGSVLSIDKVVLDFEFPYSKCDVADKFLFMIRRNMFLQFDYWMSTAVGSFRYQYKFKCDRGHSFWIGIALNGAGKPDFEKGRIEFNPNKVADDTTFKWVFDRLIRFCLPPTVRRFDLACDFMVSRENCFLMKDRRKYQEVRNSWSDRTQYLGVHNSHGFVKLYNKQIESKLAYPVTRLEITVDWVKRSWEDLMTVWPDAQILENYQMKFDEMKMSETDRYILFTGLQNPEMLSMLGKDKRKKIERILGEYVQHLKICEKDYTQIIDTIQYFVNWQPTFETVKDEEIYNPFTDGEVCD